MTRPNSLPVLGCAVPTEWLERHRDWILSKQRDVELQSFHRAEALDGDWRPEAERTKRLLDGHTGRLSIHGPFWGFKIDSHDPEIRAVVTRRLMQALDVCAAVGARQIVIHSPYSTWDDNNLAMTPSAREELIERVRLTLAAPLKRAEETGCVFVLENIEDKNPHERARLMRALDSAAVKLSIDTGHAHYAHCSTGAPPVDYYVEAAGEMLEHVHIQDSEGYADRHWKPGDGTIRWAAVFRALALLPHSPRLILELKNHAEIPAAAAWLEAQGLAG